MGPFGGFFARATLWGSEEGGGGGGGDIPVGDEDIGRVEDAEEAGVVDDFVSNEGVEVVGDGVVVGKQRAEDERGDADWKDERRRIQRESERTGREEGEDEKDIGRLCDCLCGVNSERGRVEDREDDRRRKGLDSKRDGVVGHFGLSVLSCRFICHGPSSPSPIQLAQTRPVSSSSSAVSSPRTPSSRSMSSTISSPPRQPWPTSQRQTPPHSACPISPYTFPGAFLPSPPSPPPPSNAPPATHATMSSSTPSPAHASLSSHSHTTQTTS